MNKSRIKSHLYIAALTSILVLMYSFFVSAFIFSVYVIYDGAFEGSLGFIASIFFLIIASIGMISFFKEIKGYFKKETGKLMSREDLVEWVIKKRENNKSYRDLADDPQEKEFLDGRKSAFQDMFEKIKKSTIVPEENTFIKAKILLNYYRRRDEDGE